MSKDFFDIFVFVLITGKTATVKDIVQIRHFSFSQLLAHCFNVDFSFHPKIIDKLRTIQVILERIEICRSVFLTYLSLF